MDILISLIVIMLLHKQGSSVVGILVPVSPWCSPHIFWQDVPFTDLGFSISIKEAIISALSAS